ncbi:TTC26 [Cordylochernes scorpioides]|uniref:TTC26 n=1 Tax=Cordylochernes scorpioides TaxID=51811 RepID=A0ABY6LTC7_9ARAC|nr:TTC26 [Cordylochernes scorpioides]
MWKLAAVLLISQTILIILAALFVKYHQDSDASDYRHSISSRRGGLDPKNNPAQPLYPMLAATQLYSTAGLGLTFCLLRRYTGTPLKVAMLAVALGGQWAVIAQGLVKGDTVHLDLKRYHDFCNMGGERLTLQVEQTIRTLSKEGNSYRVIVKKLKAEGLDVGKATICRVVNGIGKKREAESNGQKYQVDRPRPVRTPATVSKVKRLATTENPPSQRQLSRMCGTSLKTINNIIHKNLELDTRRKGKVHKLTPFHMKNRATNARKLYEEHLAGSRSEYTATLDEAWMYVTYCNGIRKICYIKRGNQVPDNWVHQCSETFPKGFMVVGVMTGRGVLPLIKVPSKVNVNSEFYIECVLKPVIEQLKDLYPGEMDKVFLHHDKASSHTSNKTQQFLQEMKDTLGLNFIRNSDIPVKSPDASPLDFYGFGMLKQRLFNRRPKTEAGLWKAAQEEWSNVSLSKVKEGQIQDGVIAGGVAIGASAQLMVQPYGSLMVGMVAAGVTAGSLRFLAPKLRRWITDSTGVLSVHGLPGLFGGVVSAICAFLASTKTYGHRLYEIYPARSPLANSTKMHSLTEDLLRILPGVARSAASQAGFQLAAMASAIGIALGSGAICAPATLHFVRRSQQLPPQVLIMLLSRAKPATSSETVSAAAADSKARSKIPNLKDFLKERDFTGALTLLRFKKSTGKGSVENDLWMAYCAFHLGNHRQAAEVYETLLKADNPPQEVWAFLSCCYFYLGMYKEAQEAALKAPSDQLQNRLLFHLAHKFGEETELMAHHQKLQDILEDQLSLASIHYLRSHYQEAIDIYKHILLEHRDFLALNVYVALCYYKLDYFDVCQEILSVYLQRYPDSATALNLKACSHFKLYNGKAAEVELKALEDLSTPSFTYAMDLLRHNLVVFRGGEGALQVLPSLVDVIPEARLNLVIYYLRRDEVEEAYNLIKDLEAVVPHEYILKGVVNAAMGQKQGSREHLKIAQQFFQLVGASASECDTIPGRQCMASCFFVLKQFDDVLLYLNSIKSYFYNDDTFNFNYAQAKAATGSFKEAEEIFHLVQSEKLRSDYVYLSWLARCYIMNKKSRLAWEMYLKMETSTESFSLLQLIANDCYKMGQFLYSAKAFDVLEKMDPNPEYWEGKRGACVGVLQMIIAGHEPKESIVEVLQLLRSTMNPQVEGIVRVISKWAKENRVGL